MKSPAYNRVNSVYKVEPPSPFILSVSWNQHIEEYRILGTVELCFLEHLIFTGTLDRRDIQGTVVQEEGGSCFQMGLCLPGA